MKIKNHKDIISHLLRMANIKKKLTKVGEDARKNKSSDTVCGNVNWCNHFCKQNRGFSKKKKKNPKVELSYNTAIPVLGVYPEKNENTNSKRYMHHNVHSSIIYNAQDMETT